MYYTQRLEDDILGIGRKDDLSSSRIDRYIASDFYRRSVWTPESDGYIVSTDLSDIGFYETKTMGIAADGRGLVASAGMSHKENVHPENTRDGKTSKFRSCIARRITSFGLLLDVASVLKYL